MTNNSSDFEDRITGRILQNIGIALLHSPVIQRTLPNQINANSISSDEAMTISKNDDDLNVLLNVCMLSLLFHYSFCHVCFNFSLIYIRLKNLLDYILIHPQQVIRIIILRHLHHFPLRHHAYPIIVQTHFPVNIIIYLNPMPFQIH